jgi:hypothetical protein
MITKEQEKNPETLHNPKGGNPKKQYKNNPKTRLTDHHLIKTTPSQLNQNKHQKTQKIFRTITLG